jgi:hypothetical protein
MVKASDKDLASPSIVFIKEYSINSWKKLDEYFAIVNETPALYTSIVICLHRKWKYFEITWRYVATWKNVVAPRTWLPSGKKALNNLWDDYKFLDILYNEPRTGAKRARSPDLATDMTLISDDEDDHEDELEVWIRQRCFKLPTDKHGNKEPLGVYWLRQRKNPEMYRLA